ncbi:MAG: hypothetical protein AB7K04_06865 [Pseudorhodoplanes sp.]
MIELVQARAAFIAAMREEVSEFDVLAMPTVPTIAPAIAPLAEDDEAYARTNLFVLRNPSMINMMDGCAISLPMHRAGEVPTGLTLAKAGGEDQELLSIAAAVEAVLAGKS